MSHKTYEGHEINIHFDMKKCIHARNCYLKLPSVFDPAERPWVMPNNAPAEEISAMIRTCPSGALTFTRNNLKANEVAPAINRITVLENGPLAFTGDLEVDGAPCGTRSTLCRCGLSKNKPWCDYSHVAGQFKATGEPETKTLPELNETGGSIQASRISSGPLKVEGNMEITSGTGKKIAKLSNAFLCRCGASRNKPFCDGSHKEANFDDVVAE